MLILGVIIGLMGVVYNTCLSKSQDLYQKLPGQTMRLLIPFMLAGVFGFLYPSVLGGGHSLVEVLSSGEMVMGSLCLLFVLKFVFSMVSFGSGAPGGIFLPLLVMGAVIGGIYFKMCIRDSCITLTVTTWLKEFATTLAATDGGPAGASRTISIYIYQNLYSYHKAGYGQAVSLAFLILLVAIGLGISAFFRKREVEL